MRQILCCIAAQPSWSQRTVQLAERFARRGVVGVDIASGEMHFEETATGTDRVVVSRPRSDKRWMGGAAWWEFPKLGEMF